ncbi:unnamed protein product, partial [Ascophyllum nodosum]
QQHPSKRSCQPRRGSMAQHTANTAEGVIDEDMDLSQGKSEVPTGAPLQIMTQFLRAVSESRMVDALALAQTILTFEPSNTMITDYQATLAQYINNGDFVPVAHGPKNVKWWLKARRAMVMSTAWAKARLRLR